MPSDRTTGTSARPTFAQARWYALRRAQSTKPSTYRCPICGKFLPALTEHVLVFPEGDHSRRRHAHTACVAQRRAAGRLPTRGEWLETQPRRPGTLARLVMVLRRRSER